MTRPLALLLLLVAPGCSGDGAGHPGDGDADADADGDADGDADPPVCDLDCSGLDRALSWDQQAAVPTCETSGDWSEPPETGGVEQDDVGRVIHWEVTLRYENNHQFVVRYDVESFCPDGSFESLRVEAESFDPLGTWSCSQFFICL